MNNPIHNTFNLPVKPRKKGRKRKNADDMKPKRPLSAYNYFFKAERERIIASVTAKQEAAAKGIKQEEDVGSNENNISGSVTDDKSVKDPKNGTETNDTGSNEPPEDPLSFRALGKRIAERWKNLTPEELDDYKKLADEDTIRYKREMDKYKKDEEERREKARIAREEAAKYAREESARIPQSVLPRQSFQPNLQPFGFEGQMNHGRVPTPKLNNGAPGPSLPMQMGGHPGMNEPIVQQFVGGNSQIDMVRGGGGGGQMMHQQGPNSGAYGNSQVVMLGGGGGMNPQMQQMRILNSHPSQMGTGHYDSFVPQQQFVHDPPHLKEELKVNDPHHGGKPETVDENGNVQLRQQIHQQKLPINGDTGGFQNVDGLMHSMDNGITVANGPSRNINEIAGVRSVGGGPIGFQQGMYANNGLQIMQEQGFSYGRAPIQNIAGPVGGQMHGGINASYIPQQSIQGLPLGSSINYAPANSVYGGGGGVMYEQHGAVMDPPQGQDMYILQQQGGGFHQNQVDHGQQKSHPGDEGY